jgi:hypothetical protein
MILFLRGLFLVVLASMLAVTTWASLQCPLFGVPREVATHPWFIATLFDTYWAFVAFFVWVCFKQAAVGARVAWFVAIMLLGNIAMAVYCLRELFGVPATEPLATVVTRRREGFDLLGALLAVAGIGVIAWATLA